MLLTFDPSLFLHVTYFPRYCCHWKQYGWCCFCLDPSFLWVYFISGVRFAFVTDSKQDNVTKQ